MRFAVALLIGCVLCLGQNAKSSETKEKRSTSDFVQVEPGTRIYFQNVRDGSMLLGPGIRSDGVVTVYFLGENGVVTPKSAGRRYTVTRTGVLIPKIGEPDEETSSDVYRTREPIFYTKGFKDILIPVNVLYSKSQQEKMRETSCRRTNGENEVISEEVNPGNMEKVKMLKFLPKKDTQIGVIGRLVPDKNCNGEITMFILDSEGVMQRIPPDPYLPNGINLSFVVKDNFLIRPKRTDHSDESVVNFVTGTNGDLIPHPSSELKLRTDQDEYVAFILGECGSLIPVREEPDSDGITYKYNGQVIHKSRQFSEIFSNSEYLMINDEKYKIPEKKKPHSIRKRSLYPEEFVINDSPNDGFYPQVRPSITGEVPVRGINPPPQTIMIREPIPGRHINYGVPPPSRLPVRIAEEIPPRARMIQEPRIVTAPPREIPIQQVHIPIPPREIPPRLPGPQREVPVKQIHVPMAPVRVPIPPREIPVHVPIPQREIPIHVPREIPVRVPIPQREIPLPVPMPPREMQQIRMPAPEPEIMIKAPIQRSEAPPRPRIRDDLYVRDEKGEKICLEPEFTEHNDVVLYKLTCKGNLVRFPSCKEPEYGFPIHFKILLEEFVLVPVAETNCGVHITYILQENGDLIPCESNKNTFKKAPGSLLYFMLGKDNVLFPVQQKVNMEGGVSYYYQDKFLLKLTSTANKPLHFSTLGRPLFVYYNGLTVMTSSSKPRLNSCRGSNWKNHCTKMGESESKDIFLAGPCGQLIRVTPFKTKSGSTVIYEMDNNGILYRSPKDKKRCIILKSYIVLKEGILLPSNETTGYMFMSSKNGDMFPYLYPEGKLEAPRGESIKYLLCEKGILLPMELEIVNNQICYFFLDVIVYKEKVYTKEDLDNLSESSFKLHYKNECDEMAKHKDGISSGGHFTPFTSRDGSVVYYEKCDNMLKRRPTEVVPKYLSYTMGSFEIQPDGSLFQIKYQDPDRNVINLMLEPNGDLMEDRRNMRKPSFNYYVLDVNGNLIAVEAKKTKKNICFYKNNVKVCRAPLPRMAYISEEDSEPEASVTPLGLDPLRLMDEPEPDNDDYGPICIPVPLKSISLPEPGIEKDGGKCRKRLENESEESENKDGSCKETMALELEINDEVIEEIKNWANKCDKMLSRREVEDSLTEALQGLSVAALFKDNVQQQKG